MKLKTLFDKYPLIGNPSFRAEQAVKEVLEDEA